MSRYEDDPFMKKVSEFFRGEGPEAEDLIEQVAQKLLEIDMVNPDVIERVVQEVYEDLPRPPDLRDRAIAKMQELRKKKDT